METQEEKTVAMNVRKIPASVYRRFKITCLAEGKTVQDKVLELIEAASAETVVTRKSQTVYGPDGSAASLE